MEPEMKAHTREETRRFGQSIIAPVFLMSFLTCLCALLSPLPSHAGVIDKLNVDGIALTFDACETKTVSHFDEKILSCLIGQKIPFTVFMTGRFANHNRKRLKEISKLPFVEIENHSFNHRQHMEKMSAAEIRKEVKDLDDLVFRITGKRTKYFRFPAGNSNRNTLRVVEGMHYKVVAWSYESGDPNTGLTLSGLTDRVISKTRNGNILIFHINGRGYCTGEALPAIIMALRGEGFTFVKLEDGAI
jgi:peptidoglycan-N-acetylglucosamine deacetylase